jgi:hypothetical protein
MMLLICYAIGWIVGLIVMFVTGSMKDVASAARNVSPMPSHRHR